MTGTGNALNCAPRFTITVVSMSRPPQQKRHVRNRTPSKKPAVTKPGLHPRNRHQGQYDFAALIAQSPALTRFVLANAYGNPSIDFANPAAVKALNQALLKLQYGISGWDIPTGYLCPPVPGRADYLHHLADLLARVNGGVIPRGKTVRALDIGTGANAIYPLLGYADYGWSFIGTDIDPVALNCAEGIVQANRLSAAIDFRLQESATAIFNGVVQDQDFFDLTLCNPPFHGSRAEAREGSERKWRNLGKADDRSTAPVLNFGGQATELWCEGGEELFLQRMITESAGMAPRCFWFTSLVSKAASLPGVYAALEKTGARDVKTVNMSQGQKQSRIVAWTFFDEQQTRAWSARQSGR